MRCVGSGLYGFDESGRFFFGIYNCLFVIVFLNEEGQSIS